MKDHHNLTNKDGSSTEGENITGQNEMILKIEQRILELQEELAQVHNLAKLSPTLNIPLEQQIDNHTIPKSQAPIPSNQMPPSQSQTSQNIQSLPNPIPNIQNTPYVPTQHI